MGITNFCQSKTSTITEAGVSELEPGTSLASEEVLLTILKTDDRHSTDIRHTHKGVYRVRQVYFPQDFSENSCIHYISLYTMSIGSFKKILVSISHNTLINMGDSLSMCK
jgi:hypothetical protein